MRLLLKAALWVKHAVRVGPRHAAWVVAYEMAEREAVR